MAFVPFSVRIVRVSFEKLIESRIQEAMAAGAFDQLKGAGERLERTSAEELAGDMWMGYKVLQNGGMLPAWLLLAKEIEVDGEALTKIEARFREWVDLAAAGDAWKRHRAALRKLHGAFAEAARRLRVKQDQFNYDAPVLSLERPGIWVEYRLGRLEAYAMERGGPEGLFRRV